MRYPGGKNLAGVYQRIINQIPPHDLYVEMFLGSGAIMRAKRPALASIVMDRDAAVLSPWLSMSAVTAICGDAIEALPGALAEYGDSRSTFVYADPPYPISARSAGRAMYTYEMSDGDHVRFLDLVRGLRCMVAISGYHHALYDDVLGSWRLVEYPVMTRGGRQVMECLWMNYPEPFSLHDYRYLGENYRERERIKRKQERWRVRLAGMPAQERYAMLSVITPPESSMPPAVTPGAAIAADTVTCGAGPTSLDMASGYHISLCLDELYKEVYD